MIMSVSKFGTALESESMIDVSQFARKQDVQALEMRKLDKHGGKVTGMLDMGYNSICHLGYDKISLTCAVPAGWVNEEIRSAKTEVRGYTDSELETAKTKVKKYTDGKVANHTTHIKVDGTVPMAANLNLANHRILNLPSPQAENDSATKKYVDGALPKLEMRAVGSMKKGYETVLAIFPHGKSPMNGKIIVSGLYLHVRDSSAQTINEQWAAAGSFFISYKDIPNSKDLAIVYKDVLTSDAATNLQFLPRTRALLRVYINPEDIGAGYTIETGSVFVYHVLP